MKHQPQLTGIVTESVDCGPRSVQMAIDWATRGTRRPSIRAIRRRMGLDPSRLLTTNPALWEKAIESFDTPKELGGEYERLTGSRLGGDDWDLVEQHLRDNKLAIVAVDYGVWRRLMPAKSGSLSFDGYHAIPLKGVKNGRTRSFDPLLDGRYRGCPNGPVMVPLAKAKRSAVAVGRQEIGRASVYAYLVDRATRLGTGVDIPEPEEPLSLASILSILVELGEEASGDEVRQDVSAIIDDLETLIGPYDGEAEPGDDPVTGVKP